VTELTIGTSDEFGHNAETLTTAAKQSASRAVRRQVGSDFPQPAAHRTAQGHANRSSSNSRISQAFESR
jgi:hypothetical protein